MTPPGEIRIDRLCPRCRRKDRRGTGQARQRAAAVFWWRFLGLGISSRYSSDGRRRRSREYDRLPEERANERSPGSSRAYEDGKHRQESLVSPRRPYDTKGARSRIVCHGTDRRHAAATASKPGRTRLAAFGFVGLTNFSIHQPYRGQLAAHDPRSEEGESASRIKLPDIVLGPRESLLLPLRIPLTTLIPSAPPGLDPADEVYYSTAELTAAGYDGSTLKFQFNTPCDGEIALRLARRPQTVRLDGDLMRLNRAVRIF